MSRGTRVPILLAAGLSMLAAAVVHGAIGVPHIREDLQEIQVRATLVRAILVGMHFGTVAMLAFALVVLLAASNELRGRPNPAGPLWVIAAAYAFSGIGASFVLGHSPHALGFVAIGILVAAGATGRRSAGPG